VPPRLDIPKPEPTDQSKVNWQSFLDALHRFACQLDTHERITAVGASWEDFVRLSGRPELASKVRPGGAILDLFADEPQRNAFHTGIASLSEGQPYYAQILEWGTPQKPLTINLVVHPIHEEEQLTGYLVQGLDISQETVIRTALLDRERRLRDLRTAAERQLEEITSLKSRMQQQADEISQTKHQFDQASHTSDHAVACLLQAFAQSPQNIATDFCRLAAQTAQAQAAFLTFYDQDYHWSTEIEFAEADIEYLSLAQIAVPNGCAIKYNHLLDREDCAFVKDRASSYGLKCLWVFPLDDGQGLFGTLHLYYTEEDMALPVDAYTAVTSLCHSVVPLLHALGHWPKTVSAETLPDEAQITEAEAEAMPEAIPEPPVIAEAEKPEGFRVCAASLAEEFGNLLTGVLGHSSLVAAEMGDNNAAVSDIRAIERSARNAAKLTRRLFALCGSVRKTPVILDLNAFIRDYAGRAEHSGPQLELADRQCLSTIEAIALEIILEGLENHARSAGHEAASLRWQVSDKDDDVCITLHYPGPAALPNVWTNGNLIGHSRTQIPELIFARESARASGGDLMVEEEDGVTRMSLVLPRATVTV
jgi:hypothetical protein